MQRHVIVPPPQLQGRKQPVSFPRSAFTLCDFPATRYIAPVAANVFRHTHRVTYADCTLGNHIYYSRYLDLLEAARGEFFRRLGLPLLQLQAQDTVFPVIECRLVYKSPARYDDILTIEVWPALAEGARLNFGHRILKELNVLVLEAETFHVCAGVNEKPKRLPADLITKVQPFLNRDGHG